jgi:hypothetical protein
VTPSAALEFVRERGVVLESGAGPVPALTAAIVGHPIRGSWWAHSRAREIFAATRAVRGCADVLVCRLVAGKVTYVHRRIWPALVRLAERFPNANLAQIHEVHTVSGRHVAEVIDFPKWVPRDVAALGSSLEYDSAVDLLGRWCDGVKPIGKAKAVRRKR